MVERGLGNPEITGRGEGRQEIADKTAVSPDRGGQGGVELPNRGDITPVELPPQIGGESVTSDKPTAEPVGETSEDEEGIINEAIENKGEVFPDKLEYFMNKSFEDNASGGES